MEMSFSCEVCNLIVNSQEQLTQHVFGKSHQKKASTSNYIPQSSDYPVAQTAKAGKRKKGRISMNELATGYQSTFVPEVKEQSVPADVEMMQYTDFDEWKEPPSIQNLQQSDDPININPAQQSTKKKGSKRTWSRNKAAPPVPSPTVDPATVDPLAVPLGFDINPQRDALQSWEPVTKKIKSDTIATFCTVCNKALNSPLQAEAHYASIKHIRKAAIAEEQSGSTVDESWTEAVTSWNHSSTPPTRPRLPPQDDIKNLKSKLEAQIKQSKNLLKKIKSPAVAKINQTKKAKKIKSPVVAQTNQSQATQNSQSTNVQPPAPTSGQMFCTFCNIGMNSQAQVDSHRQGARHKKNVAKAQLLQTSVTSSTVSVSG